MKTLQTIAAGVLVLGMGSAFAAEPVALNDSQMDNVSAGALVAGSSATAYAEFGLTATQTTANGFVVKHGYSSVQGVSTTGTAIAVGVDPYAHSTSFVAVTH
ncbi:MAG: hypothetical protein ACXWF8_04900 [Methylobacter sp.]